MRLWKMEAVRQIDLPNGRFNGQAVQVTPSLQGEVIKSDALVIEGRQFCVQIQQVVTGIDTTADTRVVEAFQILIKKIDIVIYFSCRDDKAEILVGRLYLYRFDITRIVFVQEGLERGGQILDRKFSDDGSIEFIAHDSNGLVAIDDARFDGKGIERDALPVLKDRGIVDTGIPEEIIDIASGEIDLELAVEFDLFADEMQF